MSDSLKNEEAMADSQSNREPKTKQVMKERIKDRLRKLKEKTQMNKEKENHEKIQVRAQKTNFEDRPSPRNSSTNNKNQGSSFAYDPTISSTDNSEPVLKLSRQGKTKISSSAIPQKYKAEELIVPFRNISSNKIDEQSKVNDKLSHIKQKLELKRKAIREKLLANQQQEETEDKKSESSFNEHLIDVKSEEYDEKTAELNSKTNSEETKEKDISLISTYKEYNQVIEKKDSRDQMNKDKTEQIKAENIDFTTNQVHSPTNHSHIDQRSIEPALIKSNNSSKPPLNEPNKSSFIKNDKIDLTSSNISLKNSNSLKTDHSNSKDSPLQDQDEYIEIQNQLQYDRSVASISSLCLADKIAWSYTPLQKNQVIQTTLFRSTNSLKNKLFPEFHLVFSVP